MTAALVLIVLVSTTEARSTTSTAVQHAAQEVLGNKAQVTVEGYTAPPDDAELMEKARSADLVAELSWQDAQHRHALVHCYVSRLERFVNRQLDFEDQDDLRERGRLIGFALASMAPEQEPAPEPAAAPQKPEPPVKPKEHASREPQRAIERAQSVPLGAVDATFLGAVGVGGPADGLGAGIAGRWFFHRGLALRLATGVRYGDVSTARAVSELFFGGLGLAFQFSNPESFSALALGGRTDLLVMSYSLRHRATEDEAPQHQSRVMGGADLLLEGTWYVWKHAGLFVNGGSELAFGHTDVLVRGKEVADIPPLRLVGEAGIRATF
jgi:hypothetical protein